MSFSQEVIFADGGGGSQVFAGQRVIEKWPCFLARWRGFADLAKGREAVAAFEKNVNSGVTLTAVKEWRVLGQPAPRPNRRDGAIVVPVYQGRRGHPTLFARRVFADLLTAPADRGVRQVLDLHKERVRELAEEDAGILARIDTPEDYQAIFREEARK